jgi:DNA-binding MurR/RpiR family transcriptional regulator
MINKQLENNKDFTFQEKEIGEFILANPLFVVDNSAKELAECTFTSSSTITRFVKKLGFKGYNDFKIQYVREYTTNYLSKGKEINRQTPNAYFPEILDSLYNSVILNTRQLINTDTLNRIVNMMLHKKRIDLYGNDMNYPRLKAFAFKLNGLGFNAHVFNAINEDYLKVIQSDDIVAILVTHTGKNPVIVESAINLRKLGVFTIAITSKVERKLELVSNESLFVAVDEDAKTHQIEYGISIEYLLDILFMILMTKKGYFE